MQNFTYSIPTTVYFGEGQIQALPAALKELGTRVLLVYGGGSIKRIGLYDAVIELLDGAGIQHWELGGVDPNPRLESVHKGAALCKEHEIQAVLAIGGGSSIDCAKVIAAAALYEGDAWDLVVHPQTIQKILPIASILTLSATGSEMDCNAVITNLQTNEKIGTAHRDMRPRFSILDPTYTFSVPKNQTAAGTADIISHIFEVYFSKTPGTFIQKQLAEGLLRTCFHYGPIAVKDPDDYEARANLMWASSLAINGLISSGNSNEWTVHPIEHVLSAHYDITHGVGLAILTPHWMRFVCEKEENLPYFAEYGKNIWGLDASLPEKQLAQQAIEKTEQYFASLGLPAHLKDVGIPENSLQKMAYEFGDETVGAFQPLSKEDVLTIYKRSY